MRYIVNTLLAVAFSFAICDNGFAAEVNLAQLSSPANGATFTDGAVTFTWNDTGAERYSIWIGSTSGAYDIYGKAQGTATSVTIDTLPTDGRTLYLRLFSKFNGSWGTNYSYYNEYVFTAYTGTAAVNLAQLSSPTSGSTLTGSSVTFAWSDTGASKYSLWIGSTSGSYDVYGKATTGTSLTATGLPTDGSKLYVRLFSKFNGSWGVNYANYNEYTFTAYSSGVTFKVVDAAQSSCYDRYGSAITCPSSGQTYYGQDAQYTTTTPSYSFNSDKTVVIDNNTGLMWEKAHHDTRVTGQEAVSYCENLSLGGYTDWRLPSVKESFSIMDARGAVSKQFYIDSTYFDIAYPTSASLTGTHTPEMMGQTWTGTARPDKSSDYYFVNFFDGHVKSAPISSSDQSLFYRCVRGDSSAFSNSFTNNGDGTVSDKATGLMWQQANGSSGGTYQFIWENALSYCEDLSLAGYSDWRLPDVKELQSIVDYSTTSTIDSNFTFNQASGTAPFFWSSTTHGDNNAFASYVCFGNCWNYNFSADIHGPGAQRSDPKYHDGKDYSAGIGDQEDYVQIDDYVRCVRNGVTK